MLTGPEAEKLSVWTVTFSPLVHTGVDTVEALRKIAESHKDFEKSQGSEEKRHRFGTIAPLSGDLALDPDPLSPDRRSCHPARRI